MRHLAATLAVRQRVVALVSREAREWILETVRAPVMVVVWTLEVVSHVLLPFKRAK